MQGIGPKTNWQLAKQNTKDAHFFVINKLRGAALPTYPTVNIVQMQSLPNSALLIDSFLSPKQLSLLSCFSNPRISFTDKLNSVSGIKIFALKT